MTNHENQFRRTAADLAAQLQAASTSAVHLADALERAEQTIVLLKKHMTTAQLLHAHLEIDALPVLAAAGYATPNCVSNSKVNRDADATMEEAFRLHADADSALRDGPERMTAFSYFKRGAIAARELVEQTNVQHTP